MKNISDMFTNVFLLSPETFYPAFILHSPLSTLFPLCPLAILPNILVHDGCRKNKATAALQIKRLAHLFGYKIFCCGNDFFHIRVPE